MGPSGPPGPTGPAGTVALFPFDAIDNSPALTTGSLTMYGPTASVTVTAGQSVTATIDVSLVYGGTTDLLGHSICYASTGGTPEQFMSGLTYTNFPPVGPSTPVYEAVTATATHVFGTGGTYSVGWCGLFYSNWAPLTQLGFQGWALVTN